MTIGHIVLKSNTLLFYSRFLFHFRLYCLTTFVITASRTGNVRQTGRAAIGTLGKALLF
jgi:hypothetical protein